MDRGQYHWGWTLTSLGILQRQTVVSQFYQLDRLVVEGQKTVRFLDILRSPRTILTSTSGKTERRLRGHSEAKGYWVSDDTACEKEKQS